MNSDAATIRFTSLQAEVTLHELSPDWITALQGWWGRQALESGGYQIEVERGTAQGGGEAVELSWMGGRLTGWRQGNRLVLPGQVCYEVSLSAARIELGPQADIHSQATLLALHLAFLEAQRACGLLCLHAAVVRRDDHILAITGMSGAGKSSAALRLSRLGWSLVAEDTSWLTEGGVVVGWDDGLRLWPDAKARFAPEWPTARLDAHGKVQLEVKSAAGGLLSGVLALQPGADQLMSPAEQVRTWWQMAGLPSTPLARQRSQAALGWHLPRLPVWAIDRDALIERLS